MSKKKKPKPTHRLWLGDEFPSIGSGWRGVTVTKVGHKWVHFFETATGYTARSSIFVWNDMKKWGPNGEELSDAEQRFKAKEPERKEPKRRRRKAEVPATSPEESVSMAGSRKRTRKSALPEGM
jgi:hypothetical protein